MLHDISLVYFTVAGVLMTMFIISDIAYKKAKKKEKDKKENKKHGEN